MRPSSKKPLTNVTSASGENPGRKRTAPLSLRLSEEERARLEYLAGDKPIGTYIRAQLFGEAAVKKSPVRRSKTDYQLLARILGVLGESELSSYLCMLTVAAEAGTLDVDASVVDRLHGACDDIAEVRFQLIKALGLRPEP